MTRTTINHRAAPTNPTRDGMVFCDEGGGGCGASLTETDQIAGYCTNCGRSLETETDNETQTTINQGRNH